MPPITPYQASDMGDNADAGYSVEALGGLLYRVDFQASRSTPEATASAYAMYRAAEWASKLAMPAFRIEQGPADGSLIGDGSAFEGTTDRDPAPMIVGYFNGAGGVFIPIVIPSATSRKPI